MGNSLDDLEFIYAPDADTYKDGAIVYNKCSDMAAIVSLYIEYGNSDQTERKEAAVTEALRILSDWEKKSAPDNELFPAAQLSPLLAPMGRRQRRPPAGFFLVSVCHIGMLRGMYSGRLADKTKGRNNQRFFDRRLDRSDDLRRVSAAPRKKNRRS